MSSATDKMKAAIDRHRAANGEPKRPKPTTVVPGMKKPGAKKPEPKTPTPRQQLVAAIEEYIRNDEEFLDPGKLADLILARFPQIRNLPRSKVRICCGTLFGQTPHKPDCVQVRCNGQPAEGETK